VAVMVLGMQTDTLFWDLLVFTGIDDVEVEAVTAASGTVEVVAKGRLGRGGVSGLRPLLGPGPRPLPAQAEGPSARSDRSGTVPLPGG
jgi:hypothetical protein